MNLLNKLSKFKSAHTACRKVYCSTCGGLASAVKKNMSDELSTEIKTDLLKMSLEEFINLRSWSEFFSRNYPNEVGSIIERDAENVDTSKISNIDHFLLKSRHWRQLSPAYEKLLQLGIEKAIQSENESLIETLSIVLGENLSKHKQLFELAMKKNYTNKNIHRVLYNNFREKIPELREFIGKGNSVSPNL